MYVMLGMGIAYRIIAIACGENALAISICPIIAHIDAFARGALLAINMYDGKKFKNQVRILSVVGIIGIMQYIFQYQIEMVSD